VKTDDERTPHDTSWVDDPRNYMGSTNVSWCEEADNLRRGTRKANR
jgi:hypothetical protein